MEESLSINGKKYISTKAASRLTGYTSDYVGQLAREGRVDSKKFGRTRFVDENQLLSYVKDQDSESVKSGRGTKKASPSGSRSKKPKKTSSKSTSENVITPPRKKVTESIESVTVLPHVNTEEEIEYVAEAGPLLPELKKKGVRGEEAETDESLEKNQQEKTENVHSLLARKKILYPSPYAQPSFGRKEIGKKLSALLLAVIVVFAPYYVSRSEMAYAGSQAVRDFAVLAFNSSKDSLGFFVESVRSEGFGSLVGMVSKDIESALGELNLQVSHGVGSSIESAQGLIAASAGAPKTFQSIAVNVYQTISTLFTPSKSETRLAVEEERQDPVRLPLETPDDVEEQQDQQPRIIERTVVIESTPQVTERIIERTSPLAVTQSELNLRLASVAEEIRTKEARLESLISQVDQGVTNINYITDRQDENVREDIHSNIAHSVSTQELTVSGDSAFDTNTLYIDSEQNRVGIGTITPTALLDVAGVFSVDGSGTISSTGGLDINSDLEVGGESTAVGTVRSYTSLEAPYLHATSTSATSTFAGHANIGGGLIVTGSLSGLSFIETPYINATSTTATSTFSGNVAVTGRTDIIGTFNATGASAFSTLTSSGLATLNSLSVLGATDVTGDLAVNTNMFTVASSTGNTTIAGTLNVGGDATFSGALSLTGALSAPYFVATSSSATSTFAGSINIGSGGLVYNVSTGTLGVGTTTPSGGATFGVDGDAYIGGNLTVSGDSLTLGTESADTLVVNAFVGSDLVPNSNATYDLGSPSFYWDDAYFDGITVNNISANQTSISGTQSETFTINSDNSSSDIEDASLVFYRGVVTPNAILRWSSTDDQFEFTQNLVIQNETPTSGSTNVTVKAGAGQSGNLFSIQNNSGTNLFSVSSTGVASTTALIHTEGTGTSTMAGNLQIDGRLQVGNSSTYIDSSSVITTSLVLSGSVTEGTWNGSPIEDAYLTKTGDWTGTIDGFEGADFLTLSEWYSTTTDALAEGSNLYYTDERVDDRTATLIQNGTGISWAYDDGVATLTPTISLAPFSTSDLSEGSNLYFTDARADARINATSTIATLLSAPNLATVGTITTGAWQGSVVADTYIANDLTITGGAIDSTTVIDKDPVITLGGDLSGSVTLSNLASGTLTATVGVNTVALGTDTTGSYVASLGTLTGLSTVGNTGEGSTPTLSVLYGSTANTAVQGNTQISVTAGTALSGGGTVTLGSGGAVTLNVTADSIGDTQLAFNTGQHLTTTSAVTFSSVSGNGSGLTALNASNLSSGTVPSVRVSGSYTGITGLGTITAGTWQGSVISSTYLDSSVILSTEIDASSEIAGIVGDETGSGALVFANSPSISNPSVSGSMTVGSTGDSANRYVRVLSGDGNTAGFEAYGASQGTGYLYVGQSTSHGGGMFYNGDGSPTFATGEGNDRVSFYRKSSGTNEVVFSYAYSNNTVDFRGGITLGSALADAYVANDLTVTGGSIDSTTTIDKDPVITLGGDLSGNVTLSNLASGTLTATVVANSVALGTDTTGNYVSNITGGTAITVSGTAGEGWTPTVAVTADSIGDTQLAFNTGQHLTTGSSPTFASVNTGQGDNELYAMNQNVQTSDSPTFAGLTVSGNINVNTNNLNNVFSLDFENTETTDHTPPSGETVLAWDHGYDSTTGGTQDSFFYYSTRSLAWVKLWAENNDGPGSGLDADLLDGQQGSFYQNASNLSSGTVPNARISGAYSGISTLNLSGTLTSTASAVINTSDQTMPRIVLDSSGSGDNWTSQGAYISLGESGDLGSASTHLTYRGDGYGFVGAGTVTNGQPAGGYWRFQYNSASIFTNASVTAGSFSGSGASLTSLNASNLSSGTVPSARISGAYNSITSVGTITSDFRVDGGNGIEARRGMHGGYNNSAPGSSNWGSSIWSIGSSWNGSGYGTSFTPGSYGLAWLRSSHPNVLSAAGEGLHIYRASTLVGAIGINGAYFYDDVVASSFSGSGASLTSLNASNLSSGTVSNARISGAYSGITTLTTSGDINGQTISSAANFTGTVNIANSGSAATPALRINDTNDGFYRPAADQVAYSIGGVKNFLWKSSNSTMEFGSAGDTNLFRNAASVLRTNDSFIVDGNLSIGTTGADSLLHVSGNTQPVAITITNTNATANYPAALDFDASAQNASATWRIQTGTTGGGGGSASELVFRRTGTSPVNAMSLASDGKAYLNSGVTFNNFGHYLCLNTSSWEITRYTSCSSSSARFKNDIENLNYGLADVMNLRPVSFVFKPEMNMGDETQVGFIAEEMDQTIPELTTYDNEGRPSGVNYINMSAVAINAIKDIGERIDLIHAPTSTPSISIDSQGRVAIGTITPQYDLHVDGDVAAKSFVNVSTKESKKNIKHLSDEETEDLMEKIRKTDVATYQYKDDSSQNRLRLGLIAEEVPEEIKSDSGKGVDIYKLSTLALAGVKVVDRELKGVIDSLGRTTEELERAMSIRYTASTTATSTDFKPRDIAEENRGILSKTLLALGAWIEDGMTKFETLYAYEFIAEEVRAKRVYAEEELEVGTGSKPSGIVMYDHSTGEAYCVYIDAGSWVKQKGTCENPMGEQEKFTDGVDTRNGAVQDSVQDDSLMDEQVTATSTNEGDIEDPEITEGDTASSTDNNIIEDEEPAVQEEETEVTDDKKTQTITPEEEVTEEEEGILVEENMESNGESQGEEISSETQSIEE